MINPITTNVPVIQTSIYGPDQFTYFYIRGTLTLNGLNLRVPGISGNLVVKSRLPPRSGSSLEVVEPHP